MPSAAQQSSVLHLPAGSGCSAEVAPSARWLPTTDATWVVVALAVVAALSFLLPIQPEDFWWNMALGRATWQNGHLPAVDTFSYTQPGEPIFVHGWLPQVCFYLLYTAGGAWLILLVQAAILTITYGLLLLLCVRRGARPRLAAVLLLVIAVPLSASNWNVRPQSYALILCVLMLLVLTRWQRQPEPTFWAAFRRDRLWALPVLMLLWVNMHGSFVLGGLLIALTFLGEAARRVLHRWPPRWMDVAAKEGPLPSLSALFAAGALSAAVIPLNPTGLDIIRFTLACASDPARRVNSVEWRPPVVTESDGPVFFAAVVGLLVALPLARRRPSLVDLLLLAAFFWLGLQGVRYIVWFPIILVPILAELLNGPREATKSSDVAGERSPLNLVLVTLAVGLVIALSPPLKPHWLSGRNRPLFAADTPVAAVEALQELSLRPQRLFHSCSAGSYLMWAAPEQGVFLDSRLQDFYRPQLVADYCALTAGERVPELLAEYRFDGLLLSRQQHAHLIALMETMPGWREVYADATHILLVAKNHADSPPRLAAPR
jgi:hypothetical protein